MSKLQVLRSRWSEFTEHHGIEIKSLRADEILDSSDKIRLNVRVPSSFIQQFTTSGDLEDTLEPFNLSLRYKKPLKNGDAILVIALSQKAKLNDDDELID